MQVFKYESGSSETTTSQDDEEYLTQAQALSKMLMFNFTAPPKWPNDTQRSNFEEQELFEKERHWRKYKHNRTLKIREAVDGENGPVNLTIREYDVVILGGGALKDLLFYRVAKEQLCVVSDEQASPYERPGLLFYMMDKIRSPKIGDMLCVDVLSMARRRYAFMRLSVRTCVVCMRAPLYV
jgi:hypothetical protein